MRRAVVLFNLGGPDSLEAVQPFLINLFSDRRIIGLPNPLRWGLANLIGRRRAPVAREIYRHLGGSSPLLVNTLAQAEGLRHKLGGDTRVFVAMRYWHPRARETAREVAAFEPDQVVLLPLYPQHSTTTVTSSLDEWRREARRAGIKAPMVSVCCYPTEPGFIHSLARLTDEAVEQAAVFGPPRILFSAHGLPERVIERGDPYQWQCEETAKAIFAAMRHNDVEWINSYQSRVGPLKWIGPATDDEIRRAGAEGRPLVVVPIAFVSEHSETLVELDIEYRELAHQAKVPVYLRVPTSGVAPEFIAGLARLVEHAGGSGLPCVSQAGGRLCPHAFSECPLMETA